MCPFVHTSYNHATLQHKQHPIFQASHPEHDVRRKWFQLLLYETRF